MLVVIRRTCCLRVAVWSKQYQSINVDYQLTWILKTGTGENGLKMSLKKATT